MTDDRLASRAVPALRNAGRARAQSRAGAPPTAALDVHLYAWPTLVLSAPYTQPERGPGETAVGQFDKEERT